MPETMADCAAMRSAKGRVRMKPFVMKPVVRRSALHGLGAFAKRQYRAGRRVIEYTGERIDEKEVERRYAAEVDDPHTFLFSIGPRVAIDATVGGNAARYVNHSCAPNCETRQIGQRVFIVALRNIARGEELTYAYWLQIERGAPPARRRLYACRCGAATCRGTMLAGSPRNRKRRTRPRTV